MTEPNAIEIKIIVPYLSEEERRNVDERLADAADDWAMEYPDRTWDIFYSSYAYYDELFEE